MINFRVITPRALAIQSAASRTTKPLFCFTIALGLASGLALGLPTTSLATEQLVEAIAAQVGSEVVLASEVMELAGPVEERMRQAGAPASEIQMVRKDALERLIEGRLVASVVERLELGAGPEEVDAAITGIASDNSMSVEQLLRSIESHGLSIPEYRAKIKDEIERSKVINAMVRSRVQITDEEVQALYDEQFANQRTGGEEIYLRHILVSPEGRNADSPEAACRVIREVRAQIISGSVEFTEIAQRVSDMNPERGGELGWMHREELAGWMESSVNDMAPGDVSEAISMPFGCNLLQVVERRDFQRIEFKDAEPQLQNVVYQRKTEVEYEKWLEVLRNQTYIERKAGFGG